MGVSWGPIYHDLVGVYIASFYLLGYYIYKDLSIDHN